MPSILLVEDHLDFANALRRLLNVRTGFELIDVVASAEDALKKLPDLKADLILVDVSLPLMNGIKLVRKIHAEFPQLRFLILSGHMSPKYVKRSLEAGARGYILKDDVPGILEGIQRVLDGEIYFSQSIGREGYVEENSS